MILSPDNKLQGGMVVIDATMIKLPVINQTPQLNAGGMYFDKLLNRMKYCTGGEWITITKSTDITDPINVELNKITAALNTKVDTVISGVSYEPAASISGTTLYINFPVTGGGGSSSNDTGLFSTAPEGSIQGYALLSGQTHEDARGRMGDQSGRDGTIDRPYRTRNGWCVADGNHWEWEGETATVVKQVPNLNDQSPYLAGTPLNGRTITDRVIQSAGTVDPHTLTVDEIPRHNHFLPAGGGSDGPREALSVDSGAWEANAMDWRGEGAWNAAYTNSTGGNQPHTHGLTNAQPNHCNVIWLYNIAIPEKALTVAKGDGRYVLKTGDNMSGSLGIQGRVTPTDYGNFDERYVQKSGSAIPQMWAGDNDISVAVTGNYTRLLLSAVGHFDRPNDGTTLRQVYFTIYKNGTQVAQATTTIYNTKGGSKGHSWRYEDDGVVFKQYGITMAPGDVIRVVGSGSYLKSTNIRVDFC